MPSWREDVRIIMAEERENMSSVDYDQTKCTDLSTEVKSKLKLSEKGLLKWTGNFELLKKVNWQYY